jgi:hypothetical protein
MLQWHHEPDVETPAMEPMMSGVVLVRGMDRVARWARGGMGRGGMRSRSSCPEEPAGPIALPGLFGNELPSIPAARVAAQAVPGLPFLNRNFAVPHPDLVAACPVALLLFSSSRVRRGTRKTGFAGGGFPPFARCRPPRCRSAHGPANGVS